MDATPQDIHVAFFPFMADGHMLPFLDIAKLFASHNGVRATIITTPLNVPTFSNAIETSKKNGGPCIHIEVIRFPAREAGLPEGYENMKQVMNPELLPKFFRGSHLLRDQLEEYLERVRPDCLVADSCFPWATYSAARVNIPRLGFQGTGNFALCAQEIIRVHEPYKSVTSNDEPFVLPSLPHEVRLTRLQLQEYLRTNDDNEYKARMFAIKVSELESYGVIVNSFYELEPDYSEFFKNELGRRAWNIGPVSLINSSQDKILRGGSEGSIDEHECLKWLNLKKPNSVIYLCFGSQTMFIGPQLYEIAIALENSGQEFIWVVKRNDNGDSRGEEWLPQGFEKRIEKENKGLIIRGWAPQVLILEHEAIGAFVTHCGWNSLLEGITAGVPLVTWPICSEQFYNEKLVTQILKIGVPVGAKKWSRTPSIEEMVKHEGIENALREIMDGSEAEGRRMRAKKLKEGALKAFKEGGTSYLELSSLIDELRILSLKNKIIN